MPRPKDKSLQEVFLKADQALSEIKDSRLVMKLYNFHVDKTYMVIILSPESTILEARCHDQKTNRCRRYS